MALNKTKLKDDLKGLFTNEVHDMSQEEKDRLNAEGEMFATQLADIIDSYVTSGEVTYSSGLVDSLGGVVSKAPGITSIGKLE